jgi:hypothetical protein
MPDIGGLLNGQNPILVIIIVIGIIYFAFFRKKK